MDALIGVRLLSLPPNPPAISPAAPDPVPPPPSPHPQDASDAPTDAVAAWLRGARGDPRARRDRRAPNASAPPASRRARASPPKCSPERAPSAPPSSRVRARRTPGRVAAPPPRTSPRHGCCLLFHPPYLRPSFSPERRPGGSLARSSVPADPSRAFRTRSARETRRGTLEPSGADVEANGRDDDAAVAASPGAPAVSRRTAVSQKHQRNPRAPRGNDQNPRRLRRPLRRLRRPPTPTTPSPAPPPHDATASSLAARLHSCVPRRRRVGSKRRRPPA